jgi:hypothetical protein
MSLFLKTPCANFLTEVMIFEFYPTIGEGGNCFWRNEAALDIPLGEIPSPGGRWSLKFANIIDYNSDPAPGFKKTDV